MNESPWPDVGQHLLLQAALLDGEEALRAFAGWQMRVDLEGALDEGTFRLMPLAWANLSRLGCTDAGMARLKGVYRYSWCQAQVHLAATAALLEQLTALGVPAMLLKGLPLALGFYATPALRPMSDIDIMIPQKRAGEAIDHLLAQGWSHSSGDASRSLAYFLQRFHATSLYDPKGREFDIHWRMFAECVSAQINRDIWASAQPIEVAGISAFRPSAEDMLLQICAHGLRSHHLPPIRWVADAVTILRHEGPRFDWNLLASRARATLVGGRLQKALAYLAREFAIDVPDHAWTQLRAGSSWIERFDAEPGSGKLRLAEIARWATSDRAADLPRMALLYARKSLM